MIDSELQALIATCDQQRQADAYQVRVAQEQGVPPECVELLVVHETSVIPVIAEVESEAIND